ncbi:protein kinase [Microbacterium sp. ZW T2_14]|uniref:serine/threonine-protein kinase n=1 Tax=Microbacterium sp. ZW T2_14 TaxID=3378079 RepID=UPI0038527299
MTHLIEQHETVALLDGRYQLHERVGEGGMAEVYRAEDIILGRTVAVKLLKDDAEVLASPVRAQREVSALARLNDPSLVTLLEANLSPEGPRYLVMEYVDGPTLSRLLRAGPLSTLQVARLAGQLASGLNAVHAAGLVHRDVKPSNILLAPSLSPADCFLVKLADFGLAQLADATSVTTPGTVLGTAAYLAPEQVRGEASCPASDIYALGLVLLEALTGKRAFSHASGLGEVMARLMEPPAIPEDIDAAWAELLTRMTASDPAARPTALEVARIAPTLPATTTRPAMTAPLPTPVAPRIVPVHTRGHAPHPVPAAHRQRRHPGQRAWVGAGALAAALTAALVCLPFVSTGSNNPEPVAPVSVQPLVEDTSTGSTTGELATVDTSSPAGVNAPPPSPGPAKDDQPAGGTSSKAEREADKQAEAAQRDAEKQAEVDQRAAEKAARDAAHQEKKGK